MDLSSHYLLEVERLGAPYRIILDPRRRLRKSPDHHPKEATFQSTRQGDKIARRRRLC
jgi:hypothetical protein